MRSCVMDPGNLRTCPFPSPSRVLAGLYFKLTWPRPNFLVLSLLEVSQVYMTLFFFPPWIAAIRLLGSGTAEENKENDLRPSLPQSYAATVARPSPSSASTVPGEQRGQGGCLMAPSSPSLVLVDGALSPNHYFLPGEATGTASKLRSLNPAGTAPRACMEHGPFASLRVRSLGGRWVRHPQWWACGLLRSTVCPSERQRWPP